MSVLLKYMYAKHPTLQRQTHSHTIFEMVTYRTSQYKKCRIKN